MTAETVWEQLMTRFENSGSASTRRGINGRAEMRMTHEQFRTTCACIAVTMAFVCGGIFGWLLAQVR